jgi:hypothetical protein
MTKKDFEAIARALRAARMTREAFASSYPDSMIQQGALIGVTTSAEIMADMLASQNPRFDRAKFLAAC